MAAPLTLAATAGLGALALRLRDPHEAGAWGLCPFHAITGAWCPGCGSLRAVNDLTHGDLLAAASSNLVLVLALPVLVLLWVGWVRRSWTGTHRVSAGLSTPTVWLLLVPILVFSVVRNLPIGSWLAP
ncbi:MAG: DUF2752 domain-containing protein [Nocardioides sp.]